MVPEAALWGIFGVLALARLRVEDASAAALLASWRAKLAQGRGTARIVGRTGDTAASSQKVACAWPKSSAAEMRSVAKRMSWSISACPAKKEVNERLAMVGTVRWWCGWVPGGDMRVKWRGVAY